MDNKFFPRASPAGLTSADVARLVRRITFPRMYTVEQRFNALPRLEAGPRAAEVLDQDPAFPPLPGSKVGIAVGSRGIDQLREIVLAVVCWAKRHGCTPVIIPAMGSHGGASPRGQLEVLRNYGIEARTVGAEIRSSLDVEQLGTVEGRAVVWSREALAVDHLIIVNRVKPHTAFRGTRESGVTKMLTVGLGKQQGASQLHSFGDARLADAIARFADVILERAPRVVGLALIENAYHELCHVEAVPGTDLVVREPQLLNMAREQMATIAVDPVDVLIVDRIGKDISGDGMDPNITGRFANPDLKPSHFYSKMIVVLGLTPGTSGNANGIGLADFTTESLLQQVDWRSTYVNALTFGGALNVKAPIGFTKVRSAVAMAIRCAGTNGAAARVVRIRDTAHVRRLLVSEAVLGDVPVESVLATRPIGILAPTPWEKKSKAPS